MTMPTRQWIRNIVSHCVPCPETPADVCCESFEAEVALQPLPGTNSFTVLAFKSDSTLPLWSEDPTPDDVPRGAACTVDGVHSLADVDKRLKSLLSWSMTRLYFLNDAPC